ncbi:MAG: twin-arginine translocase subunit TatC [Planctomycetota bacterium]|jgi:Tat protein translocase TatC|nr:twin-arginine translocase subunit TatC [Planctomycetota bacterium]
MTETEDLPQEDDVRMTLGEHLEELRGRLWKAIVAITLCFGVAIYFYKDLTTFICDPHFKAMQFIWHEEHPETAFDPADWKLLSGSYTAPIGAVLKLAFIVSLFLSSPIVAYQIWKFISAGLRRAERGFAYLFGPSSFLLFVVGCAFGYFILIPYTLYGLSRVLKIDVISPMYTFSEYLSLVMTLTIIMGVIFQMPLLMLFFSKVGIFTARQYNQFRRYAIVGNFVLAAILSPADVLSMLIMVIPLLVLYEVGVVLSLLAGKKESEDDSSPSPA